MTDQITATIIGRGHSATRLGAQILSQSGFYMGEEHNDSDDLLPFEPCYEAARIVGRLVTPVGDGWDFSHLHTCKIDPAWDRAMEQFLSPITNSAAPMRGWKLPETLLSFPWLVRRFPEVHYVWWLRDPRDVVLKHHATDDLSRFGIAFDPPANLQVRRALSWVYQYEIVKQTMGWSASHARPVWRNIHSLKLSDYIQRRERELDRLSVFMGAPMTGPVGKNSVMGRWRSPSYLDPEAKRLLQPYTDLLF